MKSKIFNQSHVEGYLYQHKLEKKVTGPNSKSPNTPYISGTIDLATDDEMTNIVSIHYTYVVAVTKNGQPNRTFKTLANIIDGNICSVMEHNSFTAFYFKLSGLHFFFNSVYAVQIFYIVYYIEYDRILRF